MHFYRLLALCTFLLSMSLPLSSQWTEYASASSVRAIASEGRYLWLVTSSEGLVRFDKQTLTATQYTAMNSKLPILQLISSIAVDNNRVKWIGTLRGLVRYDDTDWTLYNTSNTPLTSSNILKVVVGSDNSVWVSTPNEIARFSDGTWELYTQKKFPCLKSMTSLYPSADGDMWVGRYYAQQPCKSAYVLRNGELLPVSDNFNNREVTGIAGKNNTVWFATNAYQIIGGNSRTTGMLISYDGTNSQMYPWNDIGFSDPVTFTSVTVDNTGGVWVLSPYGESAGVAHFNGKVWTMFNSTNSPLNQSIGLNMLMADDDGIIWVATENRGLLRYDGTQWKEFPRLGLSNPPLHHLNTFAIDADRTIWGCYLYSQPDLTDSCLHFTEQGWTHQPLPIDTIEQLLIDREGNRWIRDLWEGRLYRYKNGAWEHMKDSVYHLYINGKNEVWTSHMEHYDGTSWIPAPATKDASWGYCSAIAEDKNGTMWFGTSRGLVSYDGTSWEHYSRNPQDMPDAGMGALVMTCDSIDNIWMGSKAGFGASKQGLHRFKNGKWYKYEGPIDSLAGIDAIATDCAGNIWVSSTKLFRFDGKEWTGFDNTNSPVPSPVRQLLVDTDNTVWMSVSTGILAYRQGLPVSVHESYNSTVPVLAQNYPNPATASTSIEYELPPTTGLQRVHLTVWSALGMPVATLVDEVQSPGSYTVKYSTEMLSPGVYYYQLQTAGTTVSRRMVIVR